MIDNHSDQTDLSLLARLGDSRFRSQAWSDFLERYTRVFFAWFRHWGVEPAIMEDVLQETTIRVLGNIRMFEHGRDGSFRAWLNVLARNCWQQLIRDAERAGAGRKAKISLAVKSRQLDTNKAERHLIELFDLMATHELVDLAHSRVRRRVDPKIWETYRLVVLQQKPVPEVMAAQEITLTALYNRLYRVRKLLKEEMDRLEGPSP